MNALRLPLLAALAGSLAACAISPGAQPQVGAAQPYTAVAPTPSPDLFANYQYAAAGATVMVAKTETAIAGTQAVMATISAQKTTAYQDTRSALELQGTALGAQATGTINAIRAQGTTDAAAVTAIAGTETKWAVLQSRDLTRVASQTQAVVQAQQMRRQQEWGDLMFQTAKWFIPVAALALLVGVGWLFFRIIRVVELRSLTVRDRSGNIFTIAQVRVNPPSAQSGPTPLLEGAPQWATGEEVATVPAPPPSPEERQRAELQRVDPDRSFVLDFLETAIAYQKNNATWSRERIPGWREYDKEDTPIWKNPVNWNAAVVMLADCLERKSGSGTRLLEPYLSPADLHSAVLAGKARLRPRPIPPKASPAEAPA